MLSRRLRVALATVSAGCAVLYVAASASGPGLSLPVRRLLEYAAGATFALLAVDVIHARLERRGGGIASSFGLGTPRRAAAVFAAVTLLLFGWALPLDFFADDFFELAYTIGTGPERWLPRADWHHYFPLGLELLALPHRLAGWNPLWFHVHNLVVMCVTAYAVRALAVQAGTPPAAATMAGVLWLTFPLQASAGIWPAIVKFTYCTLFAVLAVLAFRRFARGGPVWTLGACALATVASMLCMEHGAAVAPLCWAAAWFDRARLRERSPGWMVAALAVPVAGVLLPLGIKMSAGGAAGYPGMSPLLSLRTASAFGWSVLTPGWSTGLQIGLVLSNRGLGVLVLSCALLGVLFGWVAWRGSAARKLGVLWVLATGAPIVLGAPGVVSRYYCLPAVGVALVLAAWMGEISGSPVGRWRAGLLTAIALAGGIWTWQWRPDFVRASAMTVQVRRDIAALVPMDTPYDRIALVDLPSHVGAGDWPATAFATGGRILVGLARGDTGLDAIRAVRIWRTTDASWQGTEAEFVDAGALEAAAADPAQIVLGWNASGRRLERLPQPLP